MRRISTLAIVSSGLALALAGCGSDEDSEAAATTAAPSAGAAVTTASSTAVRRRPPPGELVRILPSNYGPILFDDRGQVVYGFTYDRRNLSRCYGECARDWPPFITRGRPRAGRNVNPDLLGTTRRRDGKLQVTYAGKPLYFYVNEGRRQVRCHNVFSFRGLWLVVRPSGRYVR
jgi:predicted lipoprotein with Yx(FWY)xxD motif